SPRSCSGPRSIVGSRFRSSGPRSTICAPGTTGCASAPASRRISRRRSRDVVRVLARQGSAGLLRLYQGSRYRIGPVGAVTRLDGQRPELVTADRRAVVDDPDRQWCAQATHLHLAHRENIERDAGCRADDIRHDQLAIIFLGEVLQSRRDVDDLADRGSRRMLAVTEGTDDDLAAMDADADFER